MENIITERVAALSLSVSGNHKDDPSGLGTLSRLPYEIRQLIYAHVLGGKLLHLEKTLDCT